MDDNTFECPNCGAKVYPEMTRCPQCGQNMYPKDEEISPIEESSVAAGWGATLGGGLIGWLIAVGLGLILHFLVAIFVSPSNLSGVGLAVLYLAGPLGALVGGYVGAGLGREHQKTAGLLVGVLTLPMLALYCTHWIHVDLSFLLSPWILLDGLATIFMGVGGAWLNAGLSHDGDWKEKWQVRGWEDMLYQDLLRRTRFNGSIADRLIEYERKQLPQASRFELIKSAIERWERDNR